MEVIAAIGIVGEVNPRQACPQVVDQDAQLVHRCIDGDQAAWEDLVRAHSNRVYGICYRYTSSSTLAQDLTQDVFLRVFCSLAQFRSGKGSFSVWLTRLTRNLVIDNYRASKLDRSTDSLDAPMREKSQMERPVSVREQSSTLRSDALLSQRETSEMLQNALAKLSPDLRETLILRDLEELEYREIAEILEVPEGTVKSRLNRGRAELARLLRHKVVL